MHLYHTNTIHLATLGVLRKYNEGGARLTRDFGRIEFNMFNQLLSTQLMGLIGPEYFNASYQFNSSPVSTILCHLRRRFPEKGEQVCVRTESDQGLRVAKATRLLVKES